MELEASKRAHAEKHKKMMEQLIRQHKWNGHFGKSDLTHRGDRDGAPGKKFDDKTTAKDVNYYSFLCGQYDTHCDPCDYRSKRKAGCPDGSFCF